jgi:hypothetical protein
VLELLRDTGSLDSELKKLELEFLVFIFTHPRDGRAVRNADMPTVRATDHLAVLNVDVNCCHEPTLGW